MYKLSGGDGNAPSPPALYKKRNTQSNRGCATVIAALFWGVLTSSSLMIGAIAALRYKISHKVIGLILQEAYPRDSFEFGLVSRIRVSESKITHR